MIETTEAIKCEHASCDKEATIRIGYYTTGLGPQSNCLCRAHGKQLGDEITQQRGQIWCSSPTDEPHWIPKTK